MSPAPPFRLLIATLAADGDCRLARHGAAAYLDPIIPHQTDASWRDAF
jgi:hypothetical protein